MNSEKTKNSADTEPTTTNSGGFNWQQYKHDRRELHEKLTLDQKKTVQPTDQSPNAE